MIITLRRHLVEKGEVDESNFIRRIEVRELFNIPAVREGIKQCVANSGGPLALEFQEIIMGRPQRVGIVFDTGEIGFVLRQFADVWAEQVVISLKKRTEQIIQGA